jgi:gliding motility-associated-like protein
MILYGDCGGTASVFAGLYTATPRVQVYNGSTLYKTIDLKVLPGAGAEITPVCPSSLSSTTCNGGTVPGIRKFVYEDTITLNVASAFWKFRSTGYLSSATSAGRSASITNILGASSGSVMSLEATLNDTGKYNNSPTYTTVPTPFFCINTAQEYNPGAVDADAGDSLAYELVDGLDASTTPSSLVTYASGYSATAPLAVKTGTFSFSKTTGQLTFTPNLVQRSLVVIKVSEYRSGVLVGTSMREMTFIVLSSCSNRSPFGKISNLAAGTITGNTSLDICKNETILSFQINPVDSDGNAITMSAAGLASGATLTISGNGTTSPSSTFVWDISSVAAGTYYFFVTYQDDGCPLNSKQTVAYTLNILPKASSAITLISAATCVKKAVFDITPKVGSAPFAIQVKSGSTTLHSFSGSAASFRDSLSPGTYTIRTTSTNGCYSDTTIVLASPAQPNFAAVLLTPPTCFGESSGKIAASGTGGLSPYEYSKDKITYTSSGTFSGLSKGSYTITLRDGNFCTKDSTVSLSEPPKVSTSVTLVSPASCVKKAVFDIVPSVGVSPFTVQILSGTSVVKSSSSPATSFRDSLDPGSYNLRVIDANGCSSDTPVSFAAPIPPIISSVLKTEPLCFGGNDGSISVSGSSGVSPYSYSKDKISFSGSGTFSGLKRGTYLITVRDANFCTKDTSLFLGEPTEISASYSVKRSTCNAATDGSLFFLAANGTAPYQYAIGSGPFGSSGTFSGLGSGSYSITVKDANGCTKSFTGLVTDSVIVRVNPAISSVSCYQGNDGSVTLLPVVGKSPFSFALGSGSYSSSATIGGLSAGVYLIRIKDALGCTSDTTVTINEPSALALSLSLTNPSCNGYDDGAVTAAAFGGTAPYNYAVDGGTYGSTRTFSKLKAGKHTLSVKDAKNCVLDSVFILTEPDPIVISVAIDSASCYGGKDGVIKVLASGGTRPFGYSVDGGSVSASNILSGLGAGAHILEIRDANGCKKDSVVTIEQPDALVITKAAITNPTCEGYANGKVVAAAAGGTKAYSFALSDDQYSLKDSFVAIKEGRYQIKVRDKKGCIATQDIELKGYPHITKLLSVDTSVSCFGKTDGSLRFEAQGGNPPLRYVLKGTNDTALLAYYTMLSSQTYFITAIDSTGCFKSFPEGVGTPGPLSIVLDVVHNDCAGVDTNGRLTAKVSGGTEPYAYLWSFENRIDSFIGGLPNGWYSVKVTDKHQCEDSIRKEIYYDNCCTPAIPNAFTPNGDGRNDVIRILYKGDIILKEFSIYNRYGQQVFTTNNIMQGWDGRFQGKDEELGVYYYYVRLICGNKGDQERTFKGDFTLIR